MRNRIRLCPMTRTIMGQMLCQPSIGNREAMTVPAPRTPSSRGSIRRRLGLVRAVVAAGIATAALSGAATASDAPVSPTPGLTMQEARMGHTATLLADGSVLVAGSVDVGGAVGSAELYDPDTQSFEATGSLGQARSAHTATLLADGRVLMLGGWDRSPQVSAESYVPLDRTFDPAGRLRIARGGHTATLLDDGRVLVIGGAGTSTGDRPLASTELYDPVTERSMQVGRLAKGRVFHTATRLEDGRVLVIGGLAKHFKSLGSAELYDPATNRFTPVGPFVHARAQHTATLLADGRVLVVGGGAPDVGAITIAELYDPVNQAFETVGAHTQARGGHTSTLLEDGRVLVVGGDDSELASVEVYDPASGSFAPVDSLHSGRNGHRATRLDDGTVLITGGSSGAWPTDSAELFDPATMRVIAYGPVDPSAGHRGAEPSLPPLGVTVEGGRIEMAGSGFEMTFPDDWTIEVADPDPDVFGAAPGETWEALRAHDPAHLLACSVSVGVATVSLESGSGGASGGTTIEPSWDESETGLLWAPEPRIESGTGAVYSTMSPRERLHKSDPGLEHDALYVVSCSSASDGESEAPERALEGLIETFEFLPGND